MARKLYLCAIEQTRYFNIEANNEEEVMEWLQTHDFDDIEKLSRSKTYEDYWDERIIERVNVGKCDSHIIL